MSSKMNRFEFWRFAGRVIPAAPLVLTWLALRELGAYPTNDDFLFARSVQVWTDEGRYVKCALNGLPTVSAVAHMAMARMFTGLFGFSYATLQSTSVLVSCCGVCWLAWFCRCAKVSSMTTTVLALCLATNPFFFGHAFTFMTDAPAVAWSVAAVAAYWKGLRDESDNWLGLGSLLALAAIWTRETSLCVAVAPVVASIAGLTSSNARLTMRRILFSGFLPLLAASMSILGVFETGNVDRGFPGITTGFDAAWRRHVLRDGFGGCLLIGGFALAAAPILADKLWNHWRHAAGNIRMHILAALPLGLAPLGFFIVTTGRYYLTNVTGYFLQNAHFGPVILSDAYDPGRWGDMGGVAWPTAAWVAISGLCLVSFAVLSTTSVVSLLRLFKRRHEWTHDDQFECGVFGATAVACIALFAGLSIRFDRYFLVLLPLLLTWIAMTIARDGTGTGAPRRVVLIASVALLLGQAYIAVAFTHDHLAFNRACWRIVDRWRAEGIAASCIDAGYATNGWFRSAEDLATRPRPDDATRWWSSEATHCVAVGPRASYTLSQRQVWRSWATGAEHEVLGLVRNPITTAIPGRDVNVARRLRQP